jgi:asparagine synthase (glutamine-hydrolysing)
MCGIAGIVSPDPRQIQQPKLKALARSLRHRGPDGEATWINESGNVGFAHSRLAVIDRSAAACQPMHYLSRYSIVFNGEIYNYKEIREDLEKRGYSFVSQSDTEVLVAAFAEHGDACLELFDGMFAFAIWDQHRRELFCARDRFGEKPFYYTREPTSGLFWFASEMKAFQAAGEGFILDEGMLLAYLTLGSTSDPTDLHRTFFRNIRRLPPSHWLRVNNYGAGITVRKYWNIDKTVRPETPRGSGTHLLDLLRTSIKRRLRSDVALGMSLSGGLDSSLIAALASESGFRDAKAFTAVFPGFERDERKRAMQTAAAFGMEHYAVAPDATDLTEELDKLICCQEEPFTSASVYAQYKVFEAAANSGVTVLLDGQGADEIFAGYSKYLGWRKYTWLPRLNARVIEIKRRLQVDYDQAIRRDFIHAHAESVGIFKPVIRELNDLLYYNTMTAGLDELLRYSDRNSMAHGREVRLPYLFHELVIFAFHLPANQKLQSGYTKYVLREAARDILPGEIVTEKNKVGFEPPQKKWMSDPKMLSKIAEAEDNLIRQGVLRRVEGSAERKAHGAYDRNTRTWRTLIAGLWLGTINKKGSE